MSPPFDVFGLGQCSWDHLMTVPAPPEPDGKVEGEGWSRQPGGPVATALTTLARWGRRCAFAGITGDDEAARRIREDLAAETIDTSRLLVRSGSRSQEAFIAVERGTGRRQIFWVRPTGEPLAAGEVEAPDARILLTDGLFAEASLVAARGSRRTVVDAGSMRDGTRALLDVAEVFVASAYFARDLVGEDDPVGACRRIREHGAEIAGVTLGRRGWVLSYADRLVEGEAFEVDAVDTTGCGDVFHAGVVEGLLDGRPPEECFCFAAWAAARCATRLGGRAGLPAKENYPG